MNIPPFFFKFKFMKKTVLGMLMLFCCLMTYAQSFQKREITILPSSNLTIIGDSNMARFKCEFNTTYLDNSQIINYSGVGNELEFTGAIFPLNNRGFDCGSKGINQDFHDLLQTEQHPKIFLELNKIVMSSPNQGLANICISIAEKERSFEVPVLIEQGEISRFKGRLQLNIRNYNLEAPKKLFGMIIVKDEIEIDFDLLIKK